MVNIDELKLAEGVFLDVFDYILQDGVRKTLHRARFNTVIVPSFLLIFTIQKKERGIRGRKRDGLRIN